MSSVTNNKITAFQKQTGIVGPLRHEITVPDHPFFTTTPNNDNFPILIVSSPSRMGNHLLLSMLDGLDGLPVIPGEDGFLSFSFYQANQDLKAFCNQIGNIDYIKTLGTNLQFDKWLSFLDHYQNNKKTDTYSGMGTSKRPAISDFPDLLFNIDYDGYHHRLSDNLKKAISEKTFSAFLKAHGNALLHLNPDYPAAQSRFKAYYCYSGMRRQAEWTLQTFPEARLITSLRPFASYAPSHIRARGGRPPYDRAALDEALSHWTNKLHDYCALKIRFPNQVGLVKYSDLTTETEKTARSIAAFLDLPYQTSMLTSTLFGHPVRGNTAQNPNTIKEGSFYPAKEVLEATLVPEACQEFWDAIDLIKL